MLDVLLQAFACIPLWCVVALLIAIWLSYRTRGKPAHRHWRDLSIVIAFLLVTSLLWANPITAIRDSGPIRGMVVDTDSARPISHAAIQFSWNGIRGQREAWAITDEKGEFYLPWQGLMNWRVGAWPNPAAITISAPGRASGQFWQDGKPLEASGAPPQGSQRATFDGWTIRLPALKPGSQFYSPLWDDWMPGMSKRMPAAAIEVYKHAYRSACAQEHLVTDMEFQQIRAWGIITRLYREHVDDRNFENAVSKLGGTRLDWNGQQTVTPHAIAPEQLGKVCEELAHLRNERTDP